MEGPLLTRAEPCCTASGADLIGMTAMPEASSPGRPRCIR
jgi:purine nucleoside phosphorylase